MTMRPLTFFIQPIEKLTLRDAMNLQRNRLEGTKYKPQDQMELDGKGISEKREFDEVYKYPISNPNVMEAHIFQLKTMSQRVQVEAPCGCRWVVHEMLHTYPTMAIFSTPIKPTKN